MELLAGLILTATVTGCTFYKYSDTKKTVQQDASEPAQWENLDTGNILVVHYGNKMNEVYNVALDKSTNTISGSIRPFDGPALAYYEKVKNKAVARRALRHRKATKQVHFFLSTAEPQDGTCVKFPLSDIQQIGVSEQAVGRNILINLGIGLGVTVSAPGILVAIACNCPHIYVDNGSGLELNNSLFTGAIAPQLERYDYKQIPDYFKDSTSLSESIVNKLNEDQYTNSLELLVATHEKYTTVIADNKGNLHIVKNPHSPLQAMDNDNKSIYRTVSIADNNPYAFNPGTGTDLSESYLTFSIPEGQTKGKLIL